MPNGAKTAEPGRRHGISGATFHDWKAKFGGMEPSEAKRLKALDDGNARLRLRAEAMLDNAAPKGLPSRKWCRPPPGARPSPISNRAAR